MKKIPKKQFDEIIDLTRQYWDAAPEDGLQTVPTRINAAMELEKKIGVMWIAITDLLSAIIGHRGFCPDAKNDEIYSVLRILGWEVVDENQTSESL